MTQGVLKQSPKPVAHEKCAWQLIKKCYKIKIYGVTLEMCCLKIDTEVADHVS